MPITTTLNEIKFYNLYERGWVKLLNHLGKTAADDENLPLTTVLEGCGLEDTMWCLRVCPDVAAEFAQWCADRAHGDWFANHHAHTSKFASVHAAAHADVVNTYMTYAADAADDASEAAGVAAGVIAVELASDAMDAAMDAVGDSDEDYAGVYGKAYDAAYKSELQAQTQKLWELLS